MTVSGTPPSSLDATAVLNRLDWQLGEIGRREHRFAWLRDPRSGDWLAVDAYYPGNRVVVIATDDSALARRCEELVPGQGLFLLTLSPAELTGDSAELARALRARLQRDGWQPRQEASVATPAPARPEPPGPPRPPERPEPPERPGPRRPATRRPPRPRRSTATPAEGMGIGVALVVAVLCELVIGGGLIGLDAGHYVLGFGFLLDACARVLGLIAASQAGDVDAAWTSVLFGSPALWGLQAAPGADLAPAARVTAQVAGGVLALGLLLVII